MKGVRYIGPDPCPVRLGDRLIARDEVVSGPPDVLAYLLARADFEVVDVTLVEDEIKPVSRRRRVEE